MSTTKKRIKGRKVTLMALSIMFVMAILPKLAIGQDFCDGNEMVDAYGIPWRAVPPVIPEGMEPEKIEFLICNDPRETRSYDVYPDRFVVWISDSASISKCIPYPEYITRINHREGHDWRVYVKTEDAHRGQALKDSLSQLPEVVRIENHVYGEGFELSPLGYVEIELFDANDSTELKNIASSLNLHIYEQYPKIFKGTAWALRLKEGNRQTTRDIIGKIHSYNIKAYTEPAWRREAGSMQDFTYDPYIEEQWGLYNVTNPSIPDDLKFTDMDIARAWNISTGWDVNICIIDQGCNVANKDLADNYLSGYDVATGENSIGIWNEHGTSCAGIACAIRNNNYGIAGVAPDSNLMFVRYEAEENPDTGEVSTDLRKLAAAIRWAADNNADIISCSWSCEPYINITSAIRHALTNGREGKGCIVVKSAGNKGLTGESITYPGNINGVMAVGSLTKSLKRAESSSYGTKLYVMAPGDSIQVLTNTGFAIRSGTSYACPAVAGVAALILEAYPQATEAEVREIIALTASLPKGIESTLTDPVLGGWNPEYGYGLVNAYEAVREAVRRAKPGWRVLPMGNPNISDIED